MEFNSEQRVIFCDIDGVLTYQKDYYDREISRLLPGTKEKLEEWEAKNHIIILTTARGEDDRLRTIKMLEEHEIRYDGLIMGLPHVPRILINDQSPYIDAVMAVAYNLERDKGIADLEI